MNRRIPLLALVAALFLTSCTVPSVCDLYNNAQKEIEVELVRRDGNRQTIPLKPREIQKIKEWDFVRTARIHVLNEKKEIERVWEYANPPVPEVKHWKWRGWWIFSRHYFDAQVEPNGVLSILGKNQTLPISPDDSVFSIRPTNTER